MKKITKLSRIVRYYLGFHIFVTVLTHFAVHMHSFTWRVAHESGAFLRTAYELGGKAVDLFSLPLWQRFLVSLAGFPSILLQMLAAWNLMCLLKCYEGRLYFTTQTARFFKLIGIFAACAEVAKILEKLPVSYFLSFMNPPGHRMISISASNHNLTGIMLALVIVLVGWVMERAAKLQQEADATV